MFQFRLRIWSLLFISMQELPIKKRKLTRSSAPKLSTSSSSTSSSSSSSSSFSSSSTDLTPTLKSRSRKSSPRNSTLEKTPSPMKRKWSPTSKVTTQDWVDLQNSLKSTPEVPKPGQSPTTKCNLCNNSIRAKNMKRHLIKAHRAGTTFRFKCNQCNCKWDRECDLSKHKCVPLWLMRLTFVWNKINPDIFHMFPVILIYTITSTIISPKFRHARLGSRLSPSL